MLRNLGISTSARQLTVPWPWSFVIATFVNWRGVSRLGHHGRHTSPKYRYANYQLLLGTKVQNASRCFLLVQLRNRADRRFFLTRSAHLSFLDS